MISIFKEKQVPKMISFCCCFTNRFVFPSSLQRPSKPVFIASLIFVFVHICIKSDFKRPKIGLKFLRPVVIWTEHQLLFIWQQNQCLSEMKCVPYIKKGRSWFFLRTLMWQSPISIFLLCFVWNIYLYMWPLPKYKQ